jgi:hypothetical protein
MFTSPRPGFWGRRILCLGCNRHRDIMNGSIYVCHECGCTKDRTVPARRWRYTLLHRLVLLLARKPQPRNYWEVKE